MNKLDLFKIQKPSKKINPTNLAVTYTRVSTKEQADTNMSLDTQKYKCSEYCTYNNLEVIEEFGGTYESAKSDERKEFKKMLAFIKNYNKKSKSKRISFIVVSSVDRFSRTGGSAIGIISDLRKEGVRLVAVSNPIEDSHAGRLLQSINLLVSEFDNSQRTDRCVEGTKMLLLRGGWPTRAPLGYSKVPCEEKTKKCIINETGLLIQKAFLMKLHENLSNTEIVVRLKNLGLSLRFQKLNHIFKNPFYCGVISHSLLENPVIGRIEPMISIEEFALINKLGEKYLKSSHNKADENFPLRSFMKCDKCGTNLTAYHVSGKKAKYYKCNTKGCKVNFNSENAHELFKDKLKELKISSNIIPALELQMTLTYKYFNKSSEELSKALEKEIKTIRDDINTMDERFAIGKIDSVIHSTAKERYIVKLNELNKEFKKANRNISNLSNYISYSLTILSKIDDLWSNTNFSSRQKLQNLVFPEGIFYNKEKGQYRTSKTNTFFEASSLFSAINDKEKRDKSGFDTHLSRLVVSTGIEPISKV